MTILVSNLAFTSFEFSLLKLSNAPQSSRIFQQSFLSTQGVHGERVFISNKLNFFHIVIID